MSSTPDATDAASNIVENADVSVIEFPEVSKDTAIDIPVEYFLDPVDVRAVFKDELLPLKEQFAALTDKLDAITKLLDAITKHLASA
jgi:hypothetical protein